MSSSSRKGAFRGCFVFLGIYAVLAVIVTAISYLRFPEAEVASRCSAAAAAGFGGAVFLTFAAAFLWEVARRFRELSLLRASVGGAAPADGERIAACGVLVADGPLLEAPISGARAAIYKYEIVVPHQKSSSTVACSGYGLTPCHITTAAGSVRLLGYAEPTFRPALLDGPETRSRTQAYLGSAAITPTGLGAAREFLDTLVDDDGAIRSDSGSVPDVVGNPRLLLREHCVADGDSVCAFGKYSIDRGGLVPDPASVDPYPIRLRRGEAAAIGRALVASAFGYSAGAVAMTGLAVGAVWLARLMFAP
ncbi:MAG TPA: hypothetical protein PKJ99_11510 [Thermoanaerobaculales bacterium]|nr:hypothetical protein [Thermoanaerobaculales bacterium]HQL30615.1 hypothetical protein [Thermoanaerobaculales bacterium]HQN96553.1 hypothetical protein [Thermoanaerobaculales bacterium]HQP44373.1 hypothetical protein [Thermoanaerobaculales bacterium]